MNVSRAMKSQFLWILLCGLLCAPVPTAVAATTEQAQSFFDSFVHLNNSYSADVVALYSDTAAVSTERDGKEYELSGKDFKVMLLRALPTAKKTGEKTTYRDIHIKETRDGAVITAVRTSSLKCLDDRNYTLTLGTKKGVLLIVAEHTTTTAISRCAPSDELKKMLESAEKGIAAKLPLKLDDVTTLVEIKRDKTVLSFVYELTSVDPTQDMESLLNQVALQSVCTVPSMRSFVDQGATLRLIYTLPGGKIAADAAVSRGSCL